MTTEIKKPDTNIRSFSNDKNLNRIVLIGGSAGSFQSISQIVSELDAQLPIAIIVVIHMGTHSFDSLLANLQKVTNFSLGYAEQEQSIEAGYVYVVPPNHHCMVQNGKLYLHRGPRVNTFRPSIDIAFRSAAVNYAARAVGVILSGLRDDGAIGMQAIKSCGGTTIVQSPDEAEYEDMPQQVMEAVDVDHVSAVRNIINLIENNSKEKLESIVTIPDNIKIEYDLDMFGGNKIEKLNKIGDQTSVSCPACGGPLWQIKNEKSIHFRCHIGHSLTPKVLINGQDEQIQQSLWLAYRILDEKYRMQKKLAEKIVGEENKIYKSLYEDKINETRENLDILRNTLSNIIKEDVG